MCVQCIRSQVDITEGIQKQVLCNLQQLSFNCGLTLLVGVIQVTVLWCKECGRYLQPPKHWLRADLESKELLTFCIKKVGSWTTVTSVVKEQRGV